MNKIIWHVTDQDSWNDLMAKLTNHRYQAIDGRKPNQLLRVINFGNNQRVNDIVINCCFDVEWWIATEQYNEGHFSSHYEDYQWVEFHKGDNPQIAKGR